MNWSLFRTRDRVLNPVVYGCQKNCHQLERIDRMLTLMRRQQTLAHGPTPACCHQQVENNFHILGWLEKIRRGIIFHDIWKLYKIECFVFRKLYWNTTTPIHFCIACGYFCTMTEELSGGDRDWMAHVSKICTFWPFAGRDLPTPALVCCEC